MKFNYKGQQYNTYENNRLQVTDDEGLKLATINAFFDDSEEALNTPVIDLVFQLALMSARYEDIVEPITAEKVVNSAIDDDDDDLPAWAIQAASEAFGYEQLAEAPESKWSDIYDLAEDIAG